MKTKTRKFIWSAPLVAALAIIGALTLAGVLLMPNADTTEAQGIAPEAPSVTVMPGPARLTVTWRPRDDGGSPITGYTVEHKLDTATEWASMTFPAGARTHMITSLTNGSEYNVRVKATNANGDSGYGMFVGADDAATTAAHTPGAVHPSAPQNPMVSSITATTFTVSWDEAADLGGSTISGYTVAIARTDGTSDSATCASPITDAATRESACTSLTENSAYTVTITATVSNTSPGGTEAPATVSATTKKAASITLDVTAATGENAPPTIEGFSSSPGGSANLVFRGRTDGEIIPVGGSIVLFLEDDFQVPGTIRPQDVFFTSASTASGGSPVSASRVVVDTEDAAFTGTDAHTIRVYVPNMTAADTGTPEGIPDTTNFTLSIVKEAGIKNDTEAGSYEVAYQVLGPAESVEADFEEKLSVNGGAATASNLVIKPKVKLSDDANKRGYELTITANGLNKGRNAGAFVLSGQDAAPADCRALIVQAGGRSARVGEAVVDSVHTAVFTVEVTTDDFTAGNTNHICVADDDANNQQATTIESFNLEPSIAVEPKSVSAGDEVTVKLRDFEDFDEGDVVKVTLGGMQKVWTKATGDVDAFDVDADGKEFTFNMPGGLEATIEISVEVDSDQDGEVDVKKQTTITVSPGTLNLSKTEVAPNESIVITGEGFSEKSYINVEDIKIGGQPLVVDESGTESMVVDGDTIEVVKTTSGGTFSATVRVWADGDDNPALDAGTYEIEVTDGNEFEATTSITVKGATLMVHPEIAGPRDYIKISGTNWPVSTSDADQDVEITIDEGAGQMRTRSTGIDSTGRFYYEYQLRSTVQLGKDHTITVLYDGDGGSIEEEITFAVPSSNVTITPAMARPGDTVTLELTGMPIIELVDAVIIDGSDRLHNVAYTTDPEGDVTVEVTVPYADPGFYPVRIVVEDVTAIVQLEILGEASARGAATPLPDALTDLGDNLQAVFYFDNVGKTWSFYDPRPEFAELNTLTELAENNPYWILINEDQDVVLDGVTHSLSCVGTDCWNLVIW